jgi:hypothetical protein
MDEKAERRSQQGQEYSPEGVDLTLIRWMLSLSPAERLQVLQNAVRSILRMRAARNKS